MKKRLLDALNNSSETRAYLVYGLLLVLRAWREIPHLRPTQLLVPATLLQITVFIIAALHPLKFFVTFSIGNLLVVVIFISPILLQPQKTKQQVAPSSISSK